MQVGLVYRSPFISMQFTVKVFAAAENREKCTNNFLFGGFKVI